MFKVTVSTSHWGVASESITCRLSFGGIQPSECMTRKDARAYVKARKAHNESSKEDREFLRIERVHVLTQHRQLTPKKYKVEQRCTRKDSQFQTWETTGFVPGKRQAARDYVTGNKAYDERHRIAGWKYRIVEVAA